MSSGSNLQREGIALDIEQVRTLNLPSNPTKKADSRAREYVSRFGDACWELDAVPPDTLSQWVRDSVVREIDMEEWSRSEERTTDDRRRIIHALDKSRMTIESAKTEVKKVLNSYP